ncbi:hypothetical protein V6N13_139654 [Hibiscus sabdariffa]
MTQSNQPSSQEAPPRRSDSFLLKRVSTQRHLYKAILLLLCAHFSFCQLPVPEFDLLVSFRPVFVPHTLSFVVCLPLSPYFPLYLYQRFVSEESNFAGASEHDLGLEVSLFIETNSMHESMINLFGCSMRPRGAVFLVSESLSCFNSAYGFLPTGSTSVIICPE